MNSSLFNEFKENCLTNKYLTPFNIPASIWGMPDWNYLSETEIKNLLFPFIKYQLNRAKENMEIYKDAYRSIDIESLRNMDDFCSVVPFLVKDTTIANKGFREKVKTDPYCLMPKDIKKPMYVYKSGGTKGVATPTFNTRDDLIREAHSLARAYYQQGLRPGDTAICTYNPTHKGGEVIKEASIISGINFIPRRTNESAKDLIKMIETYKVNLLLTAQGPIDKGDKDSKGGGIDFFSLVEEGQDIIEKYIKIVWLGGYKLIDEAIEWAKSFGKPLVCAYGACEAIANGTNSLVTDESFICKYNNLHLMYGPNYVEVVKYENGNVVSCKKGETGMVAITTVAREGTIYIRYLIGDQATIIANEGECPCGVKTKIISNLQRIDHPEDLIASGCMCTIG